MSIELLMERSAIEGFDPSTVSEPADNDPSKFFIRAEIVQAWFFKKYPEGKIETEIIERNENIAIMQTKIYKSFEDYKEKNYLSMAFGQCHNGPEGFEQRYVETAETSAIKRALRQAGFFIPNSDSSDDKPEQKKMTLDVLMANMSYTQALQVEMPFGKYNKMTFEQQIVQDHENGIDPVENLNYYANIYPEKNPGENNRLVAAARTILAEMAQSQSIPEQVEQTSEQTVASEQDSEQVTPAPPEQATSEQSEQAEQTSEKAQATRGKRKSKAKEAPEQETQLYTDDMSVEEMVATMTIEEAKNVIVPMGKFTLNRALGECIDDPNVKKALPNGLLHYLINDFAVKNPGKYNVTIAAAKVLHKAKQEAEEF